MHQSAPSNSELPELPAAGKPVAVRVTGSQRPVTNSLPNLPPKAPGERFGQYELMRKIADSGIGELYQAKHIDSGESGILKRLRSEQVNSAIAQQRFEFEMELGRRLRHPNLVVVCDQGLVGERPYLFLQEIRGPSLRQLFQGIAPWSATRELVLSALEQVGHGLAFVHRAGVVHCDVKPENILFESPHKAVVIDFGLAFRLESPAAGVTAGAPVDAAPEGFILGTPVYMPPERLRGEAGALTPATDVYAFGAILYEALAGRPPFLLEGEGDRAEQLHRLVERVSTESPPPLRQFDPQLSRYWDDLCRRCLEKKPQHRPASLERVAAEVGALARTGKPMPSETPGVVRRITRWLLKGS